MRLAMYLILATTTVACTDPAPQEVQTGLQSPVFEMTQLSTGDHSVTGWTAIGSLKSRPALIHIETGQPTLILTCERTSTTTQIRGFVPMQAWPQPSVRLSFGDVGRSFVPDVRNIGDQVAFESSFPISDDVLEAVAAGKPVRASFSGETMEFPPPPAALRRDFSEKCAALVPPGMRKSPDQRE
jgi:hypothetical protein